MRHDNHLMSINLFRSMHIYRPLHRREKNVFGQITFWQRLMYKQIVSYHYGQIHSRQMIMMMSIRTHIYYPNWNEANDILWTSIDSFMPWYRLKPNNTFAIRIQWKMKKNTTYAWTLDMGIEHWAHMPSNKMNRINMIHY